MEIAMKTYLLAGLLVCACVTGCAPSVFVAGAAAGGAVIYDPRDQTTMLNDLKLDKKAQKIFAETPEFSKQSSLHFHSYNQNLLITGQVSSIALQNRIDELSKTIPGANMVYNQTRATAQREDSTTIKDTWITTKVKSMLLAEKGLRSNDFKIITDNRIVYLMGLASQHNTDIAARIASQVDGVAKVITLVETIT
jgi:osmotically-inducible protein OsmY